MNCNNCTNSNALKEVKIKHVHGNMLRMAIPLTLRTIELVDGEINATDTPFIPSSEHPVKVVFSKGSVSVALDATMKDGNIAYIEEKGKIPVGTYAITVTCNDDNGNPYRFKQNAVLYVADATIEAGIEETIEYEVTTWYLDAAIFLALKGEDGVGIYDIETQSSGEIGGVNTVTFILTDGRTQSFDILNGSGATDSELDINSPSPIANSAVTAKFNELAGELADLFGDVDYDTSSKSIRFWDKGKTNVLASLDARPFIKDGMVSNVYISNNTLVITFNTDSGKEAIGVPLTSVFNPNNYYTKTQVDFRIASAVANINLSNYYTKAQIDAKLSQKVNLDATTGRVDASQATRVVLDYIVGIYDGEDEPSHEVNAGDVWYDNGQIHYAYNNDVTVVIISLGAPQKDIIYCNAENNKLYRWNGSEFVHVGGSGSGSGYEPPIGGIPKTDLSNDVQTSLGKADTALQSHQSLADVFAIVDYDSTTKHINFYGKGDTNKATVLGYVDATNFIKDGMVSNVAISNGNLVVTFNTDSGKEPISIALTQIFNPENYYNKTAVDGLIANKVDKETGKGLSTNDYTTAEKTKLASLENYDDSTLQTAIDGKVDKESGKSLMTDAERTKLQGIAAGAEVNVQPNWTQTNTSADDYIKNKPTLATVATSGSYNDLQDKPTIPNKVSDLTNDAGYTTNTGTVTGISVNGGATQQPTNGVVSLTIATGGDNDIVGISDGTASDGAVVFSKRNGDTVTLDFNHSHPQYALANSLSTMAKLVVCKESELPSTLDNSTIYAITDSGETNLVKFIIRGMEFAGGGGSSSLPYDAEIEYLQTTGTQYIDTGVVSGTNIVAEIKAILTQTSSDVQTFLCARTGDNAAFSNLLSIKNVSTPYVQIGSGTSNVDSSADPTVLHTYRTGLQNNSLFFETDGTTEGTRTISGSTSDLSLYLFARHTDSGVDRGIYSKLYYCKITKNGSLVRDFIPVRVGQIGYLYDRVSGELFRNNGTGSFTLGNDKS